MLEFEAAEPPSSTGNWQRTDWSNGRGNWWSKWSSRSRTSSWSWNGDPPQKAPPTQVLPEILPDVVLGWLLLTKSGLDVSERSNILAMARNKLGFDTIEAALRQVWQEEDLRTRDSTRGKGTRTTVYYGADAETWESGGDSAGHTESDWEDEDLPTLNEEDTEVYVATQQQEAEAQEALAAANRSLAEARRMQAPTKLQRTFGGQGQGSGQW